MSSQSPTALQSERNPNKPLSFDVYLSGKTQQEKELIAEALSVYKTDEQYRRNTCCNICDKELSEYELSTIKHNHFLNTCLDHRKYAIFFRADLVREVLAEGRDPLVVFNVV